MTMLNASEAAEIVKATKSLEKVASPRAANYWFAVLEPEIRNAAIAGNSSVLTGEIPGEIWNEVNAILIRLGFKYALRGGGRQEVSW